LEGRSPNGEKRTEVWYTRAWGKEGKLRYWIVGLWSNKKGKNVLCSPKMRGGGGGGGGGGIRKEGRTYILPWTSRLWRKKRENTIF